MYYSTNLSGFLIFLPVLVVTSSNVVIGSFEGFSLFYVTLCVLISMPISSTDSFDTAGISVLPKFLFPPTFFSYWSIMFYRYSLSRQNLFINRCIPILLLFDHCLFFRIVSTRVYFTYTFYFRQSFDD